MIAVQANFWTSMNWTKDSTFASRDSETMIPRLNPTFWQSGRVLVF